MVVNEIARLIVRYGLWGSVIIDQDGLVIDNSDYAVASRQLREDVLVYKVRSDLVEPLKRFLSRD